MKTFFTLFAVSLISISVMATVAPVNTTVTRSQKFTDADGEVTTQNIVQKILSYDADHVQVDVIFKSPSAPDTGITETYPTNIVMMQDFATLQTTVAQCLTRPGAVLEEVKIAAGTFTACKVSFDFTGQPPNTDNDGIDTGSFWTAAVPFSRVKESWTMKNGAKYDYEYLSGSWGTSTPQ